MLRKLTKILFGSIIFVLVLLVFFGTVPRMLTRRYADARLYDPDNSPSRSVAIVFGAGLYRDGSPTPVLRDRVKTAVELYKLGKVEKLLMSGNVSRGHNEPEAMRAYALGFGIPDQDIILDDHGLRTYDTCYRARAIYGLDSAILVTQSFHLPRAIYTCDLLGVAAIGVPADQRQYRRSSQTFWNMRETVATAVAFWEIHLSQPKPVLGNPEPIFPLEAQ